MSLEKEGITDKELARPQPVGEHRFCGKIQCKTGYYAFVGIDGRCQECGVKVKIVEEGV